MGKKAPKAPAPPDPVATANAQAAANRETAITQRDLNLINQVTPQGNVNYTYGQSGPSGVATATATQTLSPGEQKIYESDVQARQRLGNIANSQLGQLGQSLGTPFRISGVPNLPGRVNSVGSQPPATGNFNTMDYAGGTQPSGGGQRTWGNYGQFDANGNPMWDPMATPPNGGGQSGALQYGIQDAGAIGRTLDFTNLGDPNIERQRVEQALMERMDPYLQRDRTALESRLANQGIALGSKAYSTGIDEANRTYNDARLGAIAAGGQEQSRLFALGLGQAQFGNEAQNQQFSQNMANASMNNAAVGQQFNQNVTSANFQNQQRQNAITEALLQRQTPLNEISALMSGSQVNSPQFVNNPTTPVSPTDVTGPIYANYQGAMNNYNQRLQQNNAMMGGLFGLGGAALQSPWFSKWWGG